MIVKDEVLDRLREVSYPGFSRDIVSFGIIGELEIDEETIHLKLKLKTKDPAISEQLQKDVTSKLQDSYQGCKVDLSIEIEERSQQRTQAEEKVEYLSSVKYKIAVASGKGGVGKSTVAVNLAIALQKKGFSVGLLDADIYGPSIPVMLGIDKLPPWDGKRMHPIQKYDLHVMSLGFLIDNSEAVIWRGPLVARALQQLMTDVAWPKLDVVIFDMPPGTGDAQLTLSQSVELDGAVIVSTPQDVALIDAIKGVQMFRRVKVPIMGIIENMSFFECPKCRERTEIFSHGGVEKECAKLETELLGEIPIDPGIRQGGDQGVPIVFDSPEGSQAKIFGGIAGKVKERLLKSKK